MTHSIRCSCGKLKGTLNRNSDVNRCVCYCADCQAFARFLKRENEILDEKGGTSIIQTIPANVTFTEGIENLTCMRLTANGLLQMVYCDGMQLVVILLQTPTHPLSV
jgi:Family of unknown function (DUF6151)